VKKPRLKHRLPTVDGFQEPSNVAEIDPYENRLGRDREWGMSEGSKFFDGRGKIQDALEKIAKRLQELGIDYAVVGAMAMFQHGYRRFTEVVDILVTREAFKEIHRQLDGLGYVPPFQGSKNLRDTEHGVKIEFLVSGEFPGDGKPKPVAFPLPGSVAVDCGGIRYINLPSLVELKLASGMTSPGRAKDIGDVVELIKNLDLPENLVECLNPFVQAKYKQLWADATSPATRYVTVWRNKWLTSEAKSPEDMIDGLRAAADMLRSMLADGVILDAKRGRSDDNAYLVTTDRRSPRNTACMTSGSFSKMIVRLKHKRSMNLGRTTGAPRRSRLDRRRCSRIFFRFTGAIGGPHLTTAGGGARFAAIVRWWSAARSFCGRQTRELRCNSGTAPPL
jgi:hypothetical protein